MYMAGVIIVSGATMETACGGLKDHVIAKTAGGTQRAAQTVICVVHCPRFVFSYTARPSETLRTTLPGTGHHLFRHVAAVAVVVKIGILYVKQRLFSTGGCMFIYVLSPLDLDQG